MEQFVRQTLLFDFYGELLTKHQQEMYEAVVMRDVTYSEAAAAEGISRQGVHDLIKRCDRQLEEYESKLHLVERFIKIRGQVRQIHSSLEEAAATGSQADIGLLLGITDKILEEL